MAAAMGRRFEELGLTPPAADAPRAASFPLPGPGKQEGVAGRGAGGDEGPSRLGRERLWFLILLGLPSLGLALAVTTVSSLLPVLLESISGRARDRPDRDRGHLRVAPAAADRGRLDATRSSIGPRLPFVLAATPLIVVALALMPVSGSIAVMALLLVCFYLGYFTYFVPPFRALRRPSSRSGCEALAGRDEMLREVGLGIALVAGPDAARGRRLDPVRGRRRRRDLDGLRRRARRRRSAHASIGSGTKSVRTSLLRTWGIIRRERTVRRVVIANALWETSLNALRAFVVLYFTVGPATRPRRHRSPRPGARRPGGADRLAGRRLAGRSLRRAPLSCGPRRSSMRPRLIPAFFHSPWAVLVVPPISVAAVIVMTLPFVLLISVLPEELGEGGGEESSIFADLARRRPAARAAPRRGWRCLRRPRRADGQQGLRSGLPRRRRGPCRQRGRDPAAPGGDRPAGGRPDRRRSAPGHRSDGIMIDDRGPAPGSGGFGINHLGSPRPRISPSTRGEHGSQQGWSRRRRDHGPRDHPDLCPGRLGRRHARGRRRQGRPVHREDRQAPRGRSSGGRMESDEADAVRGRIDGTTDYGRLDCDLAVIEAITEDLGMKLEMWPRSVSIVKGEAFLATNTSRSRYRPGRRDLAAGPVPRPALLQPGPGRCSRSSSRP